MVHTLYKANEILKTNYFYWISVSRHPNLSEDFIREFKDEVDWQYISMYQHLSEGFIREFKDKVDWLCVSKYQHLSEDFIREFKTRVDWDFISKHQHLSEDLIREFKYMVYWNFISAFQHLSEDLIREFKDYVDWEAISIYQDLSEDFIKDFNDYVNWDYISKYQKLSKNFICEFKDKLDFERINDSWHYKSTEFKKQQIVDSGLYECHDDYFIAYKGIRGDRYSAFNRQYRYEKGGVYESWCDTSNDENSFGLSAWTEEGARDYCNELVVRVKIKYEDIGRMVHKEGKIRCFKLEVLD